MAAGQYAGQSVHKNRRVLSNRRSIKLFLWAAGSIKDSTMKKITFFILIISLIAAFTACNKKSYVAAFDELPQDRMADTIKMVTDALTGAENGWIGVLPTGIG